MLDGMRQHAGSWIIKILFLIIILVFILAYGSGSLQQGGSGILAYVDDEPILVRDFERQYETDVRQLQEQIPNLTAEDMAKFDIKQAVLAKMINTMLLERQAKALGLGVTDAELAAFVRSNPAFWNDARTFDEQYYERAVRGQGMTPAAFEEATRRALVQRKIMEHVGRAAQVQETEARDLFRFSQERLVVDYLLLPWEDFKDGVTLGEEQIAAYYKDNMERFKRPATSGFNLLVLSPATLAARQDVDDAAVRAYYDAHPAEFQMPESVHARHILRELPKDASPADVDKARVEMLKLKARLAKGENFAALAEKHSDCPSSARGGDLGWFSREAMVAPFAQAAFSQEPGVVGDPVRTEFGWHLIKVEERREAGARSFEEAAPAIRRQLAEEKAADTLHDTLDMALGRLVAGDTLAQVAESLGLPLQPVPAVTKAVFAQRLGVDEASADMLYALAPGHAADVPVEIEDGSLLAEKTVDNPESVAALDEVRGAIEEALRREAGMKLAREKAVQVLAEVADGALPARYQSKVKTSEPFQRSGVVGELGMNPTLAEAAFAAEPGQWLPEPHAVANGYALVRVRERQVPDDAQWAAARDTMLAQIRQSRQQEMFQAFVMELRDKAEVKIVDQRVLQ
jgi:peptidyl-prolyl cis-trans isomerase D